MKYLKIVVLFIIFSFFIFNISCGKEDNPQKNDEEKEELQNEVDIYYNIIFIDSDGSLIKSIKVKKGDKIEYPEDPISPLPDYKFKEWSEKAEIASCDLEITAIYESIVRTYNITYMTTEEDWYIKSKEEMVENFLNDFYSFVSPKESKVVFIFGLQDGDPSWYNYIGGSVGTFNYLIKDNDIDLDDDNYFFNSSKYKEKWAPLARYVRDKICKSNHRFGYKDIEYMYGALDFKRYIIGDPDKYLETYGGSDLFYGYPYFAFPKVTSYDYPFSKELMMLPNPLFSGWYKDSNYQEEIKEIPLGESGDITLYPKFSEIRKYTISFNFSSLIPSITVEYGEKVTLPEINLEDGTSFDGWYLDYLKMPKEFIYDYKTDITLTPRLKYSNSINKEYLIYDDKVITYKGSIVGVEIPTRYVEKDGLRAAWVSSFINSYNPSTNIENMKSELTYVLDTLESFNMNCVIFHIRTHNNAFYKTHLAPIKDEYGTYETFEEWDYLTWFIDECHNRGIAFHAWLNPYRIALSGYSPDTTSEDIAKLYKDYPLNPASVASNISMTYDSNGTIGAILNPAKDEVINYLVDVCLEIVENYDIDGIHFDDYFYHKLGQTNNILEDIDQSEYESFIDNNDTSFKKDNENDKCEWRRQNVNKMVKAIHDELTKYNNYHDRNVVFGISPTGVYRSGNGSVDSGSLTTSGGHYGKYTFSDSVAWIKNGYIDYIMPQCYTSFDNPSYYFHEITTWWNKVVEGTNVKLYIGMSISKAVDKTYTYSWRTQDKELINQLLYLQTLDNVEGVCFFSFTSLKSILSDEDNIAYESFIILKDEMWTRKVDIPK